MELRRITEKILKSFHASWSTRSKEILIVLLIRKKDGLIAKGFTQSYRIDYDQTYRPVTVRLISSIAANERTYLTSLMFGQHLYTAYLMKLYT